MNKLNQNNVKKLDDFVNQKPNTKSPIRNIINYLARETNRNKLEYGQLKYIFKSVRERCEIEVPSNQRKLYKLPNQEELERFYKSIECPIHRLMFDFLQNTGLRVGKMCALEIKNIDFEKNEIFVMNAKGGNDRIVPFGNKLKNRLKIYLSGKNNRYLFESNRNAKYSTRRIEQLCFKYLIKAEIETKITPHTFRHLYNTYLAENKVSKEHRMLLAGHKSDKVQDIYTHLTVDGIKDEIIDLLDKK